MLPHVVSLLSSSNGLAKAPAAPNPNPSPNPNPDPEQLCINYVNEMLQEQFNETVFAAERRLLKAEGIEIDDGALQS